MQLTRPTLDVQLVTSDLSRSRQFYAELMGFALQGPSDLDRGTDRGRDLARFKVGRHTLELVQALDAEVDGGGVAAAHGIRLLAFIVDDLDTVLQRFDALGLHHQTLPLPDRLPFWVAFSSDPDGNALELVGLRRPAGDNLVERMQVGLTVGDIARTTHFYVDVLGFPLQPEVPLPSSMGVVGNVRYAVKAGATTIKFWKIGDGLPSAGGAPEERTGIRMLRAYVGDVDAARAELEERGVHIVGSSEAGAGGAPRLLITDPDDNRIELVQRPGLQDL